MRQETIVIEIDRDGSIQAEADGFTGDTCVADLERLLADLSSEPARIERKADRGARLARRKSSLHLKRKP